MPAARQFLSRDPAVATTRSPYGYVDGNPLNATDPSGLGVNLPFGLCLRNPFSSDDSCESLGSEFEHSSAGAWANGAASNLTFGASNAIAGALGAGYSPCDSNYGSYASGYNAASGFGLNAQTIQIRQPGDLKLGSDCFFKSRGIDPHAVKNETVGGDISRYDLYYDKGTGNVYALGKGGKGEPIPTGENIRGAWVTPKPEINVGEGGEGG